MQYVYFKDLEEELVLLYYLVSAKTSIDLDIEALQAGSCTTQVVHRMFPVENRIFENLVLNTALRLRLIEDQFNDTNNPMSLQYDTVGTLICGDRESKLSQRQAENKIIHAKTFHVSGQGFTGEGLYQDMSWVVRVDLLKYCINGLCKVTQHEDSW